MNSAAQKVNKNNLRRLCWQAGFHGIGGLAQAIDRRRETVFRAVRRPHQFKPTYKLIEEKLIP